MPRLYAAFHHISAPDTPGCMWRLSWYVCLPSVMVTGTFPSGVMVKPFTLLVLMCEGSMLSTCWPRNSSTSCPAADISAPESGSTSRFRVPVDDDTCTVIVGAGSVAASWTLYNCKCCCWLSSFDWTRIVLVLSWCSSLLGWWMGLSAPTYFSEMTNFVTVGTCLVVCWALSTSSSMCGCSTPWACWWYVMVEC